MPKSDEAPPRFGEAIKLLTGDVFAAFSQRVELGALELQVALKRGLWGLALMLGASVMGVLALLFLTLSGVWAFGRENLVVSLLITGGIYLFLALTAIFVAKSILLKKPLPFRTLAMVLKEDSEWIIGKKPR